MSGMENYFGKCKANPFKLICVLCTVLSEVTRLDMICQSLGRLFRLLPAHNILGGGTPKKKIERDCVKESDSNARIIGNGWQVSVTCRMFLCCYSKWPWL